MATPTPTAEPPAAAPPWSIGVGLALLLAWAAFTWRHGGLDPDLFWHLKYGQLILSEHRLFEQDVFSWTAPGATWLNQEWLGQVITAWLYQLGGFAAFPVARWVLMVIDTALLVWLFTRARSPFWLAAAGAVTIQFLLYGQTTYRLQNLTTVMLTVTALALQSWWLGRSLRPWIWVYPVLVILWANWHGGGAIAGPISLSIVLAVEAGARFRHGTRREVLPLALLTGLAWVALVVNPSGPRLPLHSLATLFDPTVKGINMLVTEWLPFDWAVVNYRLYAGWLALVALAVGFSRRWPPLSMLAFAAAWGYLAFGGRRHLTLAMIASAPLAAMAFAAAWQTARTAAAHTRRLVVGAGAAIAAVLVVSSPPFRHTTAMDTLPYPSEGAMKAVLASAPGHRLLNFYDWGGLLMLRGYPEVKIFIDGRAYHYGLDTMRAYVRLVNLGPGWVEDIEGRGIDRVFMPAGLALPQVLAQSPDWRVAFRDDTAMLLEHVGPGSRTRPPANAQ